MSEELRNLNFEIICRCCLIESDQLTSLFAIAESTDLSLGDVLANISQNKKFHLLNKMELPTKICDLCQQELLSAYNFKNKIEHSEIFLLQFLQNKNMEEKITTEEIVVETDYGFVNIKSEENFENETVSLLEMKNSEDDIVDDINIDLPSEDDNNDEDNEYLRTSSFIKFHCTQCKSKFSTSNQLNNHLKIHANGNAKKFYCNKCDKCFATNRNLQRHRKLHFKGEINEDDIEKYLIDPIETTSDEIVQCNNDNQSDEPDQKCKLKRKPKPIIERHFPCEFCSSKFSNKTQLDCHMKAHSEKKFFCETCDRYFVNNRNLQRHLKVHYDSADFNCTKCNKAFDSIIRLRVHERSHLNKNYNSENDFEKHNCMPNETKTLECKLCGKIFKKLIQLRQHLMNHIHPHTISIDYIKNHYILTNLIPDGLNNLSKLIDFIVEELKSGRNQKFYSATNMMGNELTLSDSETDSDNDDHKKIVSLYQCDLCLQIFTRRYQILHHQQNEHSSDKMIHECQSCNIKYVSKQLLDYHKKTQCENQDKHFTCDVCKIKYMWKENIEQHIRIHHTKINQLVKETRKYTSDKKLECDICQKKFSRPEHLGRHKRTHNPAEKKFECDKCKKKFSRKDNLKSHMKVHDDNHNDPSEESKAFLCVFCGRKFRNSSNLVVHTRRHTGEKPFKCDFCDKGFPRSSDLRTHRRTHTGEKPHLCTLCGKGFSRSNKLTRHMRIHNGIRPYKCTYCDRAFTQSNDLTIHVRRHTGEKPYVCGICGERFIQGTALQNHRKNRGHWEDGNVNVPFSYISQNNPNPLNNSGRVDRIGMPKNNASIGNKIITEPQTDVTPMNDTEAVLNFKNLVSFVTIQNTMESDAVYEIPSNSFTQNDSN